jgi:hypothetical protein
MLIGDKYTEVFHITDKFCKKFCGKVKELQIKQNIHEKKYKFYRTTSNK